MPRIPQAPAIHGSKMWLQRLVNHYPEQLNAAVRVALDLLPEVPIEWLSPLAGDAYSEYSDQDFLDLLGAVLGQRPINTFWPVGGPKWDALGRTARGDLLLVEAKAHIDEVVSSPTCASGSGTG